MVPLNELLSKSKYVNCVKSPIALGIVEVNELSEKDNTVNCINNPIPLGIVEPVVLPSNSTVDRHVVMFRMDRKLQAISSGQRPRPSEGIDWTSSSSSRCTVHFFSLTRMPLWLQ
jgi:hypothetical protein